jgi:hypothetical protein
VSCVVKVYHALRNFERAFESQAATSEPVLRPVRSRQKQSVATTFLAMAAGLAAGGMINKEFRRKLQPNAGGKGFADDALAVAPPEILFHAAPRP